MLLQHTQVLVVGLHSQWGWLAQVCVLNLCVVHSVLVTSNHCCHAVVAVFPQTELPVCETPGLLWCVPSVHTSRPRSPSMDKALSLLCP